MVKVNILNKIIYLLMAGCIQVGICKHAKNHKLAVLNQVIKKWGKSCLFRRSSVQSVITIFTL